MTIDVQVVQSSKMTEKSLTMGGKENEEEGDREGPGSGGKNFRRFYATFLPLTSAFCSSSGLSLKVHLAQPLGYLHR